MRAAWAMVVGGSVHWTEAGTDTGQLRPPESERNRYLGLIPLGYAEPNQIKIEKDR